MQRIGRLIAMFFGLGIALPLLSLAADADGAPAVAPIFEFTVTSDASAGKTPRSVDVTAAEFTDMESAETFVDHLERADAVTVVLPGSGRDPARVSEFSRIGNRIKANLHQSVRLPVRTFGDWFAKNQRRITVVAIEFAFTTAVKYTEIVVSGMPVSHASALATGLITGGIIGSVEWNINSLISFIGQTGTPVKNLFERISRVSRNPARRIQIKNFIEPAWQFVKNTAVNFGLFNVLKFSVFVTVANGGSLDERILSAFHQAVELDLFKTATLALTATGVSFPTTKVIMAFKNRAVARAAGSVEKLLKARDMTLALNSTALTLRSIFFSSLFVAEKIHSPMLTTAGFAGLGTMFVGSIWKLIHDKRAMLAAHEKCPGLLDSVE